MYWIMGKSFYSEVCDEVLVSRQGRVSDSVRELVRRRIASRRVSDSAPVSRAGRAVSVAGGARRRNLAAVGSKADVSDSVASSLRERVARARASVKDSAVKPDAAVVSRMEDNARKNRRAKVKDAVRKSKVLRHSVGVKDSKSEGVVVKRSSVKDSAVKPAAGVVSRLKDNARKNKRAMVKDSCSAGDKVRIVATPDQGKVSEYSGQVGTLLAIDDKNGICNVRLDGGKAIICRDTMIEPAVEDKSGSEAKDSVELLSYGDVADVLAAMSVDYTLDDYRIWSESVQVKGYPDVVATLYFEDVDCDTDEKIEEYDALYSESIDKFYNTARVDRIGMQLYGPGSSFLESYIDDPTREDMVKYIVLHDQLGDREMSVDEIMKALNVGGYAALVSPGANEDVFKKA